MDPFPVSGTCNDTWPLTQAQVSYLNTLVAALNSTIESAVLELDDPDVSFADISGALGEHTWCSSPSRGTMGHLSTPGFCSLSSRFFTPGLPTVNPSPFHPTPCGQEAIARLVTPVVAAALGMSGRGAAVGGYCTGSASGATAEPGGIVPIQASGFAPNETVEATLHSTAVSLGSVTADADGNINTNVIIPLGTPAGQHEILLKGETSGLTATLPVLIPAPSMAPVFTTATPQLTTISGDVYIGSFGASGVPGSPTYALSTWRTVMAEPPIRRSPGSSQAHLHLARPASPIRLSPQTASAPTPPSVPSPSLLFRMRRPPGRQQRHRSLWR